MTEEEWLAASDPASMLDLLGPAVTVRKLRLFGVACCQRAVVAGRWPLIGRGIDIAYIVAEGQQFEESLARLQSEVLFEGFSSDDGAWRKRLDMAHWHLALAVFNTLQEGERFRAGERRPVFEAPLQDHHNEMLRFALSVSLKEAGGQNVDVFDRPDLCRPDLTRVWTEAGFAVAYHRQPDDRPHLTLFQSLTHSDASRRRDDWVTALEFGFRHEAEQQAMIARDIFDNPFRPVSFDPVWQTSTVTTLAQQMYDSRDFSAMPFLADALMDAGCDNAQILDHCRGTGPHVRGCWACDLCLNKS